MFFKAPWIAYCIGIIKSKTKGSGGAGKWDVVFTDGTWSLTEKEILPFILPLDNESSKVEVLIDDVTAALTDSESDSMSDGEEDIEVFEADDGEKGDSDGSQEDGE